MATGRCWCAINRIMAGTKLKDLRGQAFGKWRVLERDANRPRHWRCQCSCERQTVRSVRGTYLINGRSTCCGCGRVLNRVGKVFGRWTVLTRDLRRPSSWMCLCACGLAAPRSVTSSALVRGTSRSCGCQNTTPFGNFVRAIAKRYTKSATKRGYVFSLTLRQCEALIRGNCHYCGVPPFNRMQGYRAGIFVFNGIDRVAPTKGYTPSNTVSCCKFCNNAKHAMTQASFMSWVERVYTHQIKLAEDTSRTASARKSKK